MTETISPSSRPRPAGGLPQGEKILWQGAPTGGRWRVMRFHVRKVAVYFGCSRPGALAAARSDGPAARPIALPLAWHRGLAVVIVDARARRLAQARTTVYTLTNRRVVMRFGVGAADDAQHALRRIDAADLRPAADGTGDIPLRAGRETGSRYLVLWPHARPWQLSRRADAALRAGRRQRRRPAAARAPAAPA